MGAAHRRLGEHPGVGGADLGRGGSDGCHQQRGRGGESAGTHEGTSELAGRRTKVAAGGALPQGLTDGLKGTVREAAEEIIDITDDVEEAPRGSGIREGMILVSAMFYGEWDGQRRKRVGIKVIGEQGRREPESARFRSPVCARPTRTASTTV